MTRHRSSENRAASRRDVLIAAAGLAAGAEEGGAALVTAGSRQRLGRDWPIAAPLRASRR